MQQKDWPNFNKSLIKKVVNVINSGKINYTSGTFGKSFEKKFSKFIGNKYSLAICNGTAALEVAIKSLRIPKNSEILVTGRSFFSSAACIVNTGNFPVFVDVDLKTQNISLKEIKAKITKKTKAIICVHLAGLPCKMKEIIKISKKNNLKVIEDSSQAHGASIDAKHVGSFGDVSTWSFCTDKIISTLGEGGMISTNNKDIYDYCQAQINHGTVLSKKNNVKESFVYNKLFFGTNLRLTEIQSVAGLEQLKQLQKIQIKREKMAKDFFKIIENYDDWIYSYFPKKNIKNAWYRLYFFLKKKNKDKKNLRTNLILSLKTKSIRCFTGSCPEIYLEKAFRKLKKFKVKRLINCKTLGETSIALDINHTLSNNEHKKNLSAFKLILEKTFKT